MNAFLQLIENSFIGPSGQELTEHTSGISPLRTRLLALSLHSFE